MNFWREAETRMSRNNHRYMRNSKISRQSRWRGLSRKWSFSLPKHRRFLVPACSGAYLPRGLLYLLLISPSSLFSSLAFLPLPFLSSIIFSILNSSIVSISCARFVKDKKLVNVVNGDFKNQRTMLIFHIRSWCNVDRLSIVMRVIRVWLFEWKEKFFETLQIFVSRKKF